MKVFGCIVVIMGWGLTVFAQSALELEQSINKLLYKQEEKHLTGNLYGKHRVHINGVQWTIEKDSVLFTFLAKDVVRMYPLREGLYTLITFYARTDKPFVATPGGDSLNHIALPVFDVPNVQAILTCFYKAFEGMGIHLNQESTPLFESDRRADALHIHALRTDKIYTPLVYGVASALTGTYEVCYPNGNTRCIRRLKQGVCDGLQKDFYENGRVKSLCYYTNGLKDGFMYYLPDGKRIGIGYYRKGWKFGSHEWRFENGVTYSAVFRERGELEYEKISVNGKTISYTTSRNNNK